MKDYSKVVQWYRLGCKCAAALLTPTYTYRGKAKIPKVQAKKMFQEFFYCSPDLTMTFHEYLFEQIVLTKNSKISKKLIAIIGQWLHKNSQKFCISFYFYKFLMLKMTKIK